MPLTMLNFDKLPDSTAPVGQQKLTIVDVQEKISTTDSIMLQFTYAIDGSTMKINFDNCPLVDKSGNAIPYGQAKLKKIMNATNVKPQGDFTLKMLIPLLKNKSFLAQIELDKQNQKYPTLSSNLSFILPCDTPITPETFLEEKIPDIQLSPSESNHKPNEAINENVTDIDLDNFFKDTK